MKPIARGGLVFLRLEMGGPDGKLSFYALTKHFLVAVHVCLTIAQCGKVCVKKINV